MTQAPPPMAFGNPQPYQPPQSQRSNGWAIASLICGILGCLGITGLLAVVFGILGIKESTKPQTGGKGLSIAGIVLGIIGMIGIAGIVGSGVWGYHFAKRVVLEPVQNVGNGFLGGLASGNIEKARAFTTSDVTDEQLKGLSDKAKSYGKFKSLSLGQFNANSIGGNSLRVTIGGTAQFENANKEFSATLVGSTKGDFKIEDFKLD